jgi:hypothetical protein
METETETPSEIEKADIIQDSTDESPRDLPASTMVSKEQAGHLSPEPEIERENELEAVDNSEEETKWVTGFPLFTLMGAVTLVTFLMLLDTSIISTV